MFTFCCRPRFGLFSQPVSVAIGETNKFITKTAAKDDDGRVVTGPKNFYTKNGKKGKDDSVYFSRQSYICTGDLYKARSTAGLRTLEKDAYLKGGHDVNFKPAKNTRERLYKAKYEYIPLQENQKKKNYRDEEGAVKTGPRNFTTVPLKPGKVGKNTTFGGSIPYKEDDVYGNQKKLLKQEIEYHHSKV